MATGSEEGGVRRTTIAMHELIVSPFLDDCLVLRPGSPTGLKIPARKYQELGQAAAAGDVCPAWLVDAARRLWDLDIAGCPVGETVIVRTRSPYRFGRVSYELNLGCNYDCEHCYLGLKRFEGLSWPDRERLLRIMRDAGVLWLQLTGGEPLIAKLFTQVYGLAYELGMMISISSNGSRLYRPQILDLLATRRPYRVTLSVYGATAEAYDRSHPTTGVLQSVHQRAVGRARGLSAAQPQPDRHAAQRPRGRSDDRPGRTLWAGPSRLANMAPTIYGGAESLPAQSVTHLRKRKPFTGCNAGHTFFHVDPHGMASICKVGRDPQIPLMTEGVEGLRRLGGIADSLLLRQGGCTGCALSGTCGTCMPLVTLYRKAKAPLSAYCQHDRGGDAA
ncbi:MAG: radical SAM protein [Egibacteraceae bacterium]